MTSSTKTEAFERRSAASACGYSFGPHVESAEAVATEAPAEEEDHLLVVGQLGEGVAEQLEGVLGVGGVGHLALVEQRGERRAARPPAGAPARRWIGAEVDRPPDRLLGRVAVGGEVLPQLHVGVEADHRHAVARRQGVEQRADVRQLLQMPVDAPAVEVGLDEDDHQLAGQLGELGGGRRRGAAAAGRRQVGGAARRLPDVDRGARVVPVGGDDRQRLAVVADGAEIGRAEAEDRRAVVAQHAHQVGREDDVDRLAERRLRRRPGRRLPRRRRRRQRRLARHVLVRPQLRELRRGARRGEQGEQADGQGAHAGDRVAMTGPRVETPAGDEGAFPGRGSAPARCSRSTDATLVRY